LFEAELAASYARGIQQLDEHDWVAAESTFRDLLDRRAGYRDAENLQALARRKGEPEEKHEPTREQPESAPEPPETEAPERSYDGSPPVAAQSTSVNHRSLQKQKTKKSEAF
jgi:hypothetical protein